MPQWGIWPQWVDRSAGIPADELARSTTGENRAYLAAGTQIAQSAVALGLQLEWIKPERSERPVSRRS